VKTFGKLFSIMMAVITVASCDFSSLLTPESAQAGAEITSLVYRSADNPDLDKDVVAQISGDRIYVKLPYDIVSNEIPLVADVSASEGGRVEPTGPQVLSSSFVYRLGSADGYHLRDYRLVPTLDSTGLDYLLGSQPFVLDILTGIKTPLAHEQVRIDSVSREIIVDVLPGTYDVLDLAGKDLIGFDTVVVPPGASADTSYMENGWKVPYQVTLTSASGVDSVYTISVNRALSDTAGFRTVTAEVNYIYRQEDVLEYYIDENHFYNTWGASNNSWTPSEHDTFDNDHVGPEPFPGFTNLYVSATSTVIGLNRYQMFGDRPGFGPMEQAGTRVYSGLPIPTLIAPNNIHPVQTSDFLDPATLTITQDWTNSITAPALPDIIQPRTATTVYESGVSSVYVGAGAGAGTYRWRENKNKAYYSYSYDQRSEFYRDYDWVDIQTVYIHLEPYTIVDPANVILGSTVESFSITGADIDGKVIEIRFKDNPTLQKVNTIGDYVTITMHSQLYEDTAGAEGTSVIHTFRIR
jgi:hypothetical protein